MKDMQNTDTVMAQFDKLTSTYNRLFSLCVEALAPGKTQEERNVLRTSLKEFIDKK